MEDKKYLKIKDAEIQYIIKSYKTSKHIKIFVKDGVLHVTKPTRVSIKEAMNFANSNLEIIYNDYCVSVKKAKEKIKNWQTGEKIMYSGEDYNIIRIPTRMKRIAIEVDDINKNFMIFVPDTMNNTDTKSQIDKQVKKYLKQSTQNIISKKLPGWSNKTDIDYSSYRVSDTTSKYGSCIPKTKVLQFSARLSMLPDYIIDAVIVHELCHIRHKNHDEKFYNLVKKYIPNYASIDKWLKRNGDKIEIK